MSRWRAAIDQALLLQQNPGLAEEFKRNALPDGMATLIRLVSDEGGRRRDLAVMLGIDEAVLQAAAIGYIQNICLYPGSADARSLGLNSASDLKAVKEHHRLLLKWLHPDRNPDHRELAERVNRSWSAIKKSAQDLDYVPPVAPDSDYRDVAPMPASGRFPLFLWGVVGLSAFLLMLSLMPDSEIYIGSEESAQEPGPDTEQTATRPEPLDAEVESRIDALKASFETPKPVAIAKPAVIPETAAVSAKALKPMPQLLPEAKPTKPKAEAKSVSVTAPVLALKEPKLQLPAATQVAQVAQKKTVAAVVKPSKPAKPASADAIPVPEKTRAPAVAAAVLEKPMINLTTAGQALMLEFKRNYGAGEIDAFMALFSANARNERGGRQAIYDDYSKFFESSSSRKINFSNINCRPASQRITCSADYATSVKRKGKLLPETLKGQIELQMSAIENRLLIDRIRIGA